MLVLQLLQALGLALRALDNFGQKQGAQLPLVEAQEQRSFPQWYREGGQTLPTEGRIPLCRVADNTTADYPESWRGKTAKAHKLHTGLIVIERQSKWDINLRPLPPLPEAAPRANTWEAVAAQVPEEEVLVWTLVGGKAYQRSMLTFLGMMKELHINHIAFVCLDDVCLRTAAALNTSGLTYAYEGGNEKIRVGGIKFGATATFASLGVQAFFMVRWPVATSLFAGNKELVCKGAGRVFKEKSVAVCAASLGKQHHCL